MDRPWACILARNMTSWMLPGFSCRGLVAVLINYNEDGAGRKLVVCSAHLPYDSKDPPLKELEELVRYCQTENLHLVIGCDSIAHHTIWGGTNCNDRGVTRVEFLKSTNLEILNQGNVPTFCSAHRMEVIDITLGSFRLLGSVKSWGGFIGPSLSDQTYSVQSTGLHTGTSVQEPSVHQLRLLSRRPKEQTADKPWDEHERWGQIGLAVTWVQQVLIWVYKDNCPLRPVKVGRHSLKWTSKLESLRKEESYWVSAGQIRAHKVGDSAKILEGCKKAF
jgi:hypothetical protein